MLIRFCNRVYIDLQLRVDKCYLFVCSRETYDVQIGTSVRGWQVRIIAHG